MDVVAVASHRHAARGGVADDERLGRAGFGADRHVLVDGDARRHCVLVEETAARVVRARLDVDESVVRDGRRRFCDRRVRLRRRTVGIAARVGGVHPHLVRRGLGAGRDLLADGRGRHPRAAVRAEVGIAVERAPRARDQEAEEGRRVPDRRDKADLLHVGVHRDKAARERNKGLPVLHRDAHAELDVAARRRGDGFGLRLDGADVDMLAHLARIAEEVRVEVFLRHERGGDRARVVKARVVEVAVAQETPCVGIGGVVVLDFGYARLAAGGATLRRDASARRGLDAVREVCVRMRSPRLVGAEERAVPGAVGTGRIIVVCGKAGAGVVDERAVDGLHALHARETRTVAACGAIVREHAVVGARRPVEHVLGVNAVVADERAADRDDAAREGRAHACAAVDDVAVDQIPGRAACAAHAAGAVEVVVARASPGRGAVADGEALDQDVRDVGDVDAAVRRAVVGDAARRVRPLSDDVRLGLAVARDEVDALRDLHDGGVVVPARRPRGRVGVLAVVDDHGVAGVAEVDGRLDGLLRRRPALAVVRIVAGLRHVVGRAGVVAGERERAGRRRAQRCGGERGKQPAFKAGERHFPHETLLCRKLTVDSIAYFLRAVAQGMVFSFGRLFLSFSSLTFR